MKLRINTKLRAALIAAITAVGFTLPQTYGTVSWDGGGKENAMYYANSGGPYTLVDTDNNAFQLTAEPSAANATVTITSVTTKDGADFRIVGGNYWGGGRKFKDLQIETLQAGTDGKGVVLINTVPYASDTPVGNTVATIQTVAGTLGGVSNYAVLTLGTSSSTINASGTLDNVREGATLTLNGAFVFDVADASRYTIKAAGEETWSDVANKQGFKTSTGASYYVVKGATVGDSLSVTAKDGQTKIENSGGDYYFTYTGSVTDYSKFYVNAATATLDKDLSGQLVINKANATVTVDGATFSGTITGDNKANLIVQNGGKLTLANKTAFGSTDNTFTIGAGSTIDLNGQADGNYKYTLAGGTITNSGGNIGDGSSQTVALKLTEDSTVDAGSGHDFRLLGRGYAATSLDLGGKTLVKTGAGLFGLFNTTVTAGTIEIQAGTFEFNTAHGTASSAANITFNGGNATGAMNLTADITLTAQQTVSSGVGINAQNHGLTLDGAGDLTLTGTITNVSGITKTGTGTATITASGSLNRSIDVQQGSLVLSGTYAIDDIALDPDSTVIYYDSTGAQNTSGFRNVAGAKSAYTKAQDASITATGATFTVGGQTVQLNEQGKYLIAGSTDYTTLWANGGDTVDYAAYVTAAAAQEATISSVRVADGGNVNLNGGTVANLRFDTDGAVAGIEGTGTISSLTGAGTLDLHEGAQAAMAGTVSVNTGNSLNTTGEGALTVETLKVNGGTVNVASDLTVTGGGDGKGGNNSKGLFLTGSGSTVNINGGTTTVTGAVYTNGGGVAINVGTGDEEATLVARRIELGDNGGGTGFFTIGQKGKVVVTGNEDYRNDTANPQKNTSLQMAEWGQQMTDTVQGKLYAQGATAFMSNDADSTVNIDGGTMAVKGIVCSNATANRSHNINLGNNGKLVLGERGIAAESGNWNITLASGEIGMTADTTLGRDMTVTGPVTFNTDKYTWEGSGADLELKQGSEAGTMTVTGTISGSGAITKTGSGTLVIDTMNVTGGSFTATAGDVSLAYVVKTGEGAYSIGGEGSYTLSYGIALQGGTLNMSGNYDISDVYVEGGDPTYEGGHYKGNGFAVVDGTATVVSITGGTLDTTGATFTWNGQEVTVNNTTGAASVTGTSYGTFYIFTESETVVTAKSKEGEHGTLSSIYVEEGATLEVDEDINGSLIDGWSTGTVNIQESMTVTGTMEGVTLSGAGTYDLGSGVSTLGEGTSLGEDWAGIVRISNVTKNNIDLAPFVNGTLSTVELKGFSGWTGNNLWKGLNPQNIKLTDTEDGGVAWYSNAFSSSKTDTAVYSGKWSGEGTYVTDVNAARYLNHTYSGDIADWTGVFEKRGDGTSILTFIDNAEEVNVEIKRTAGTLNLVVGNGEDEFATVFNGEVTASSITVKTDASATFNELHITSAINNSGTVIFNSDLVVTDFQETASEEGYYDLNGAFSSGGNGYSGNSDSYLTIVNGGTVQGSITVTQDGTDYTLEDSGLALKGDGGVTDWDTFHVNTDTVQVSDIVNSEHGATTVEVHSGTLNVDQATALAITVTDEGTLTGEKLDANEVGIGIDATAHFVQGIDDASGVRLSTEEGTVDVKNNGAYPSTYTTGNGNMDVQADAVTLQSTATDAVSVDNALTVEKIINESEHELAVTNLVVNTLSTVSALSGNIDITSTQGDVVVAEINIAEGKQVFVHNGPEQTEVTVTITDTLVGGSATLLANLTLVGDSTLDVRGGGDNALTLGSTLTVDTTTGFINLDNDTLIALDALQVGQRLALVKAKDGTTLAYGGEYADTWFDGMFNREGSQYTLAGDFQVFADSDAFGLVKFSNVPEPTTGTLSLLALMALAARRRRK